MSTRLTAYFVVRLAIGYGKFYGIAHSQPLYAFPAFGIATWYDVLCRAAVEMEVMICRFGIVSAKRQEVEQEVVHGVGRGDGVQGDNAGIGFCHAVGLFLALAVGLRLDCELRGID